jgi:two-component system response regulator PilR (NtrC family)
VLLLAEAGCETRLRLADALGAAGYRVLTAADEGDALRQAARGPVDVVLASLRVAPGGGIALLRALRHRLDVPCLLYGPGAGARAGFEAGRAGALAFVERPFPVGDELLPALAASLAPTGAVSRGPRRGADRLVGVSPSMRGARLAIRRLATRPVPVLVQGETGTGKELAALALHEESGRGPFVAVSLPELSEGVVESELFGHRRGAFTGAVAERAGLFEAAHGGTLFLDEIGDAPPSVQVKLLRALEARAVRRVGAAAPRCVDVRVVAATHRDLGELVRRGGFREDLYFRIRGALLRLPPLRERAADLPALAEALLAELAPGEGRPAPVIAPDALALLARLPFRGNVRELRALLENALVWWSGAGPLGRAELLEALASLDSRLDACDCALAGDLLEAWRRHGWNGEAARRELGLSRAAWRSRLARLGLDVARRRRRRAAASPDGQ